MRRQCAILRIACVRNGEEKKVKCQVPMSRDDDRCRKFIIHLSRAHSEALEGILRIKASLLLNLNAEKKLTNIRGKGGGE